MNTKQNKQITSIGIFCGSSTGSREIYIKKAAALGTLLAKKNISMIYGGGNIGLMGVIADSMIEAGGRVIGVITEKLMDVELGHKGIAELKVVETMSDRKNLIVDLSDGFIAMPGGYGTFDELLEVITACQLNNIKKPIGLFNIDGFFEPFVKLIQHCVEERFIRAEHAGLFILDDDENRLLERLAQHDPVETVKWLKNFKTERF
jgi:uncharacterized protein (TIGR00730 family)